MCPDNDSDVDKLVERFVAKLNEGRAVSDAEHTAHHEWVGMAMAREARKERVLAAIIDKSLAGLIWTTLVVVGKATWEYVLSRITILHR